MENHKWAGWRAWTGIFLSNCWQPSSFLSAQSQKYAIENVCTLQHRPAYLWSRGAAVLTPTEIFHTMLRDGERCKHFYRSKRCSWGLSRQIESVRSCPDDSFSCAFLNIHFWCVNFSESESGVRGGDGDGVQRTEHWGRRDRWGGWGGHKISQWISVLTTAALSYPRIVGWLFFFFFPSSEIEYELNS